MQTFINSIQVHLNTLMQFLMPGLASPQVVYGLAVAEGDIMKAKPKHFIPRPEGVVSCYYPFNSYCCLTVHQGGVGQHPVIVLSRPDDRGFVLVTPMSHSHPDGTPTRNASQYGLPLDPLKGESQVNVGRPKLIHQDNLKSNRPHVAMPYANFLLLQRDIGRWYFSR